MKEQLTLSDIEIEKIEHLCKDEVLVEAMKKVLLSAIYENGTLRNGIKADPTRNAAFAAVANYPGMSDEQIGSDLRAQWAGVSALENGIKKLQGYKKETSDKKEEANPGI
ncbi:MAG: hypothetical protein WCQ96_03065 [Patescibacteria group bacterium]